MPKLLARNVYRLQQGCHRVLCYVSEALLFGIWQKALQKSIRANGSSRCSAKAHHCKHRITGREDCRSTIRPKGETGEFQTHSAEAWDGPWPSLMSHWPRPPSWSSLRENLSLISRFSHLICHGTTLTLCHHAYHQDQIWALSFSLSGASAQSRAQK